MLILDWVGDVHQIHLIQTLMDCDEGSMGGR